MGRQGREGSEGKGRKGRGAERSGRAASPRRSPGSAATRRRRAAGPGRAGPPPAGPALPPPPPPAPLPAGRPLPRRRPAAPARGGERSGAERGAGRRAASVPADHGAADPGQPPTPARAALLQGLYFKFPQLAHIHMAKRVYTRLQIHVMRRLCQEEQYFLPLYYPVHFFFLFCFVLVCLWMTPSPQFPPAPPPPCLQLNFKPEVFDLQRALLQTLQNQPFDSLYAQVSGDDASGPLPPQHVILLFYILLLQARHTPRKLVRLHFPVGNKAPS